eukprot:COSAG05_NODE_505_length_9196_cov_3.893591_6_plen_317_part_00
MKKQRNEENVTPTASTYRSASIANLIHHSSGPTPIYLTSAERPSTPEPPAATQAQPIEQPSSSASAAASSPSPSSSDREETTDLTRTMMESRHRMLSAGDIRDLIVANLKFQERPNTGTPDWAIYKECPKQRRRAKKSDRWANSGGMRGSRDLPYNSATPFIRRRYGSVFTHGDTISKGKRYYEYTLLRTLPDGTIEEDKSCTLFHILPGPGETDRGRRFAPPMSSGMTTVAKQPPSPPVSAARLPRRPPQLLMSVPAPPTAVANAPAPITVVTKRVTKPVSETQKKAEPTATQQDELNVMSAISALTDLLGGDSR